MGYLLQYVWPDKSSDCIEAVGLIFAGANSIPPFTYSPHMAAQQPERDITTVEKVK